MRCSARPPSLPWALLLLSLCLAACQDSAPAVFDAEALAVLSRVYRLDGSETTQGWRRASIEARPGEVEVVLRPRAGDAVRCFARDPRREGAPVTYVAGLTLSGTCWGGDPELWPLVRDRLCAERGRVWWRRADGTPLVERGRQERCPAVGGPEGQGPGEGPGAGPSGPLAIEGPLYGASMAMLGLNAVALTVLGLIVQGGWVRRPRRVPVAEVATSAALFAAALALRWWLPLHASIHENHHGYHYIHSGVDWVHGIAPFGVPSATLALAALANSWLGPAAERVFHVNVVLAALAVVGVYHTARLVFGSRLAGWSAAVLLMLAPFAIALAPSEEFLVSAAGLFLCGVPLVWQGVARASGRAFVGGILLIVLAASARDIAIVLSAAIPLVVWLAPAPGGRRGWTSWWVAWALPGVLLLPRALLLLIWVWGGRSGVSAGVIGVPMLRHLVWWSEVVPPFVPAWLALAAGGALAWMAWRARVSGEWRPLLMTLGLIALCRLEAGMVVGGWFPSRLRHHYLALALLPLPLGWLVARVARRVGSARPVTRAAWFALAPVAGALSLLGHLPGARVDLPGAREYVFFRQAIQAAQPRAQFVDLHDPELMIPALTSAWVRSLQPGWRALSPAAWSQGERGDPALPTYALLDRTCFSLAPCLIDPARCGPFVATSQGRMVARCADVLGAAPWSVVARAAMAGAREDAPRYRTGQPLDLPGLDDDFEVLVLGLPAASRPLTP